MESKNEIIERTLFEKVYHSAQIGASRVIFTFGLGHPFDLVKTRMQSDPNIQSGYLLSKDIYKKSGIRGFYVGGIPNFARSIFKESYRSPVRGLIKTSLYNTLPQYYATQDVINTATGLGMALSDTILICPLERLKVWMMTNYAEKRSFSQFFKDSPSTKELGSELFRGLKPSFIRSFVSWSSYLVAEERIREAVEEYSPRVDNSVGKLPLAEKILIGSLGGIVNCLLTLPFDTVKTQMQKKDAISESSVTKTIRNIYGSHGIRGLYNGWQVRLPHYALVGIFTSYVIQEVDKIWMPKDKNTGPRM